MRHPISRMLGATGSVALMFSAVTVIGQAPAQAATATTYFAAKGGAVNMTMSKAVGSLPVAGETPGGYVRTKFKTWTDQDRDGRNTRAEVLQQESTTKVTGRSTIRTGTWHDWYTGKTFNKASKLDIDHLVPLKEAWSSGANSWAAPRRQAFANDLGDARALNAVSLSANRSKGDREPHQWMPPRNQSRYVTSWVAVKVRWSLTVDRAERAYLLSWASRAGNPQIKTERAVVKVTPSPAKAPGQVDKRFPTASAAIAAGLGPYYRGKDPEYWWYRDADNDGITCER